MKITKKEEQVDIHLLATNLAFYKKQIKELQDKEKKTKEKIDAYMDKHIKADEKGNRFVRFTFGDSAMRVVRQARKSVSVSIEKCKETFASDILGKIIKETVVEAINEEAIEELITDRVITMEELESVTETKVTYATVIQEEKDEDSAD